jgi:hypothetical protein
MICRDINPGMIVVSSSLMPTMIIVPISITLVSNDLGTQEKEHNSTRYGTLVKIDP